MSRPETTRSRLHLAMVRASQAREDYCAERSFLTPAEQVEEDRLWTAYQDARAAYLGTFDDNGGGQ